MKKLLFSFLFIVYTLCNTTYAMSQETYTKAVENTKTLLAMSQETYEAAVEYKKTLYFVKLFNHSLFSNCPTEILPDFQTKILYEGHTITSLEGQTIRLICPDINLTLPSLHTVDQQKRKAYPKPSFASINPYLYTWENKEYYSKIEIVKFRNNTYYFKIMHNDTTYRHVLYNKPQ